MMISVVIDGATCFVSAPFNETFVASAKRLGGKYDRAGWQFDARDEARVRQMCREIYGSDGVTTNVVTLRVEFRERLNRLNGPIALEGRTIARAFGRDSGAKLGDGIVQIDGEFTSSGSTKNWYTTAQAGTVVLVRDFARAAAERLMVEPPDGIQCSIEQERVPIDRIALIDERARLAARIAEIDALLKGDAA